MFTSDDDSDRAQTQASICSLNGSSSSPSGTARYPVSLMLGIAALGTPRSSSDGTVLWMSLCMSSQAGGVTKSDRTLATSTLAEDGFRARLLISSVLHNASLRPFPERTTLHAPDYTASVALLTDIDSVETIDSALSTGNSNWHAAAEVRLHPLILARPASAAVLLAATRQKRTHLLERDALSC
ncbi:hypothetical protein BD309DRAFT_234915 [Dichomitus squalens]|uniref:Uncharacterized protein n=2 Tax=Dichomitus squalens TaxID=114155 RepID=A0A4Q9Q129_9APHY|nr:uncharacterized protein DICSQDRAFT_156817 [Dichomitus squalens LYAD-421 SS1]EJF58346.1 hypothetical protein DICSQDRAFT_156817 [Dichomitus squalens LYAD-421 SS1]TBU27959.1 hypothetical protein BD311DRAFT_788794 [Dichomitus squalens]TBU41787.1 hypothetical protein BD309DRAFT_234915 [Dichomitus squalens]TBU60857.1 hypothetical protein BD310DRAFT_271350 [Dichomitus squalens]